MNAPPRRTNAPASLLLVCLCALGLSCGESTIEIFIPGGEQAPCAPATCESLGASCGEILDGCGTLLDCGDCGEIDPGACTPLTCLSRGFSCGSHQDGCGGVMECGTCESPQTCAGGGLDGVCGCAPVSCESIGATCGEHDDGCGGLIDCGACLPTCAPATCESLGVECGRHSDGCGGLVDCGACPETCVPTTCAALQAECGTQGDGCNGTLNCGTCGMDQTCTNNVCVASCAPTSCAALGKTCGTISDGCNGTLNCGTCGADQTCTNNVCVASCAPTSCAALGKTCGTISDGCGGTLNCGTCGSNQTCTNNVCVDTALPYPTRKSVKGLQPDFWNSSDIIGNEVAGVAMNLVWETWQPTKTGACASGQVKYDGYCFTVEPSNAAAIKTYTDAGVVVTGVVYGVPSWARRSCSSGSVVAAHFCAPTESGAADYGRFAGFLAWYFNGLNGNGRVADFVIHNEVNASEWFNYGCAAGTCDPATWASVYAQSYNAAYDAVKKEQPHAKILISFEHHFGSSFDSKLSNTRPVVSAQTFLSHLIPKVGSRDWRIAWHSYPPNLLSPDFGAMDWPRVTFGNLGVLAGWLRQNYPSDPHAWEIQLTENGINGVTGNATMQASQKTQLCQAFRNVLGTPGIESFIYHRMRDHETEVAAGLGLGLVDQGGNYKPAWSTYALASRAGSLDCGFQYALGQSDGLAKVKLIRGVKSGKHWATTRQLPSGYSQDSVNWRLLREAKSGTVLLYECCIGNGSTCDHSMVSPSNTCEGQFNMGPLGYAYTTQVAGTVPLYRCYKNGDHMVSGDAGCEGYTNESTLGYVYPAID